MSGVLVFADEKPRVRRKPAVARVTYLGYVIVLRGDRDAAVYAPDGTELLSGRCSMETARKAIRRHRCLARHGHTTQEV